MDWIYFLLLLFLLFGIVGMAEFLRKIFKLGSEITRKTVHISVGIVVFPAPLLFSSSTPAIILAVMFIIINFIGVKFKLFKGMHGGERETYGTVYYPLAFLILVIMFWDRYPAIISISMLILAIADAVAAVIGESIRNPKLFNLTGDKKSIQGSISMLFATFIIVLISIYFMRDSEFWWENFREISILDALIIAMLTGIFASVFEAVGSYGLDNITIPLSSAFILHSTLAPGYGTVLNQLLPAFALGGIIAFISYKLKFLSLSGSFGTFILAVIIFGVGGWKWTIPILTFFILSSLISKVRMNRKGELNLIFEKSEVRDIYQVFANGGIGGLAALIYHFYPNEIFYYAYLASIASATADTWATEIGILFRTRPRLITSFRRVEPGTSGGISLKGTLGGLLGAFLIFVSATFWINWDFVKLTIVVMSGMLGSFIDSLLGATLQAQFKCITCLKITERKFHCGSVAELIRGKIWANNDFVNLICSTSGAIATITALIF